MTENVEEFHGTKERTVRFTKPGNTIKNVVSAKLIKTGTECNETSGMNGIQSEGAEVKARKVYVESSTQ